MVLVEFSVIPADRAELPAPSPAREAAATDVLRLGEYHGCRAGEPRPFQVPRRRLILRGLADVHGHQVHRHLRAVRLLVHEREGVEGGLALDRHSLPAIQNRLTVRVCPLHSIERQRHGKRDSHQVCPIRPAKALESPEGQHERLEGHNATQKEDLRAPVARHREGATADATEAVVALRRPRHGVGGPAVLVRPQDEGVHREDEAVDGQRQAEQEGGDAAQPERVEHEEEQGHRNAQKHQHRQAPCNDDRSEKDARDDSQTSPSGCPLCTPAEEVDPSSDARQLKRLHDPREAPTDAEPIEYEVLVGPAEQSEIVADHREPQPAREEHKAIGISLEDIVLVVVVLVDGEGES
mmetsp:Transcript_104496/g.300379  ORF Transcript_104496/g.300379 Transcript_104496/m.300379 type:complete len:352 (-) Transcript_104496:433-1488(-)